MLELVTAIATHPSAGLTLQAVIGALLWYRVGQLEKRAAANVRDYTHAMDRLEAAHEKTRERLSAVEAKTASRESLRLIRTPIPASGK